MLSAAEIAELLTQSDVDDPLAIVPTPDTTVLAKSGAASVDLRLGTWFMTCRRDQASGLAVSVSKGEALPEKRMMKTHYVRLGGRFVLHPGAFVLAATFEWLRLPRSLSGYLVGKSRWGRRGLVIATAVGVHPGFSGCLTLELTNLGELPIEIVPGMQLCQLFLHRVRDESHVDASALAGRRRPTLGDIRLDPVTRRLVGLDD